MRRGLLVAIAAAACGPPPARSPSPPPPSVEISVLTALAESAVAGMTPLGNVLGARLVEGQLGEHPLTLEPGRCYTAVGAGLPEIEELELEIVVPTSAGDQVLARDDSIGSLAIAGARDACARGPSRPTPAIVRMKATRGQGVVALQLYMR